MEAVKLPVIPIVMIIEGNKTAYKILKTNTSSGDLKYMTKIIIHAINNKETRKKVICMFE